jgi:PKD repeat protein
MARDFPIGVALAVASVLLLGAVLGVLPSGTAAHAAQLGSRSEGSQGALRATPGIGELPPAATSAPSAGPTIVIDAFAYVPTSGVIPLSVNFTLSVSRTPATTGPINYTMVWQFGDGSPNATSNVTSGATGAATTFEVHSYAAAGSFGATVTVNDTLSDPTAVSRVDTVVAESPLSVVIHTSLNPMTLGTSFTATGVASGGAPPYTAQWTAIPANCMPNALNLSCTSSASGNYFPHLVVTDSRGLHASAYANFTVNPALVGRASGLSWFYCNGSHGILQENLTVIATGGTPGYSYNWNFGDATPNSSSATTDHIFALGPTYSVSVVVTDQGGGSFQGTVNVTTSYPACHTVASISYAPPLVLLQGGIIALVVALVVLVLLLRRRRGPPPPVSSWRSGAPAPTPAPPAAAATPGPPSGPS